ncbi:unnamed protein product, partial [marine sediment metagenome]
VRIPPPASILIIRVIKKKRFFSLIVDLVLR